MHITFRLGNLLTGGPGVLHVDGVPKYFSTGCKQRSLVGKVLRRKQGRACLSLLSGAQSCEPAAPTFQEQYISPTNAGRCNPAWPLHFSSPESRSCSGDPVDMLRLQWVLSVLACRPKDSVQWDDAIWWSLAALSD